MGTFYLHDLNDCLVVCMARGCMILLLLRHGSVVLMHLRLERMLSVRFSLQTMDPTGCVWGTPTAGAQAPPPGFVPTWGYSQSVPITETAPSTPSSNSLHKCASMVRDLQFSHMPKALVRKQMPVELNIHRTLNVV